MSLGWKIVVVAILAVVGIGLTIAARRKRYEKIQRAAGRRRYRLVAANPPDEDEQADQGTSH